MNPVEAWGPVSAILVYHLSEHVFQRLVELLHQAVCLRVHRCFTCNSRQMWPLLPFIAAALLLDGGEKPLQSWIILWITLAK